jgi:hypothetical protein
MRRVAALALAFACGCTPMQWHKEDVSAEQFKADEQECRSRAWREASVRGWHSQMMVEPIFARDASGRGFIVWHSGAMVDPYGHQMLEEYRLAQFCMESKGYKLVPKPKQ